MLEKLNEIQISTTVRTILQLLTRETEATATPHPMHMNPFTGEHAMGSFYQFYCFSILINLQLVQNRDSPQLVYKESTNT